MLKKRETCNKKCTGANNKGGTKKKVYTEVEDNMQRKKKGGLRIREL
jgi:hypothetical protein